MLRQGGDPLGVKKVLIKMIYGHVIQFEKYNTNNRYLTQQLLTTLVFFALCVVCMYITYM